MDTVKFIEERNRMCKSFDAACHDAELQRCPAFKVIKNELLCAVGRESTMDATSQISIVEEWSAANPRKTRQSVFLKQYPNAEMRLDGFPNIAPCALDETIYNGPGCGGRFNAGCEDCYREFWMQEVE